LIVVESELKELLRERAEQAGIDPAIPHQVIRRARSRRRRTIAVSGLVSIALVLGAVVGVRAILDFEPPRDVAAGPEWRGLWPQTTRQEAEAAQEAADSRLDGAECPADPESCLQDDVLWQLGLGEVATRYAVEELGWSAASMPEVPDLAPDAPGPVGVEVVSCSPNSFCDPRFTAEITLERLLRPDRFGLWFVTGAQQTITPAAATEVVRQFLEARVAARSVDALISASAKGIYDAREDGLSLYGGDEGPFVGYEISERDIAGAETYLFLVRLGRFGTGDEINGTVAESLLIGPGLATNGDPQPVLVLSVSRVEFQEIDETVPPPAEEAVSAEEEITDFVTAFMEVRLAGSGAEEHLSTSTRMDYENHERLWHPDDEGLLLYGNPHPQGDPAAAYVGFRIEELRPADAQTCGWFPEGTCQDAWEVVVVTELEPVGDGSPGTMREMLIVAPADGAAAEFADWMVSGAARGAEPAG